MLRKTMRLQPCFHLKTIQHLLLSLFYILPSSLPSLPTSSFYHFDMAKNIAQSPLPTNTTLSSLDQRLAIAKRCSYEGAVAGAKAAVAAGIATAVPTLASAKMLPWARANLNHTAQALIVSTVAGMAYFIVADKTILATARKNSFNQPN